MTNVDVHVLEYVSLTTKEVNILDEIGLYNDDMHFNETNENYKY